MLALGDEVGVSEEATGDTVVLKLVGAPVLGVVLGDSVDSHGTSWQLTSR